MKKAYVHIAAFVSMYLWGISFVWSKVVFEFYTPLTTIFFRLAISFVLLFLFLLLSGRLEKIRREDYLLFAVSSLFNPFLYFVFEYHGLEVVPASMTAFIIATIPVFTPVFTYWYLKERLSFFNKAGLIISFTGVVFLIVNKDFDLNAPFYGIVLLFLAVFSAIIYVIILKKLSGKYHPVSIVTWQEFIGLIYFLPFFLYFDAFNLQSVNPSAKALLSLLMLGVFASAVAYVLYTYVISRMTVSKANIYLNLIPVFAAVTAFFLLDEIFTAMQVSGMFLVIFGVILSQLQPGRKLQTQQ